MAVGPAAVVDDVLLDEGPTYRSAMIRAMMVVRPPGGNGTISVIERDGALAREVDRPISVSPA